VSNFIFNWAVAALQAATLDLSTGNYYAHLVTTAPALGHTTVADLVLPTTGGYTGTPLTGLSYNATRWTFDSFSFPKYAFASAPTGVVICKRAGTNPANTDGIICYSDFNNSIGQTISLQVGAYVVNLQFGTNGAINFSYRYQYSSGAYANTEDVPKGLIYLIGTKNNTQSFASPSGAAILVSGNPSENVFDRNVVTTNSISSNFSLRLDFGVLQIKPGKLGIYNRASGTGSTVIVKASNVNNLWNDSANYTILATLANAPNWGFNWLLVDCNTSSYWQYLKIDTNQPHAISEIEFYESSILSPTANIV
jgi:hypothetical protein